MREASALLTECKNVLVERHKQYGEAVEVHQRMGALMGPQLGIEINAQKAALAMVQLKMARIAGGITDEEVLKDTIRDAINYLALSWECKE
jgi:hypothetical protein|tara:strand:- start:464 stop:736 length:273 start_codon:yes stop_codon:yes gene_type:complete